ncbi:maleate cis-trans isomerase family protein [Aestuariispira insulae]|uniref:Maleate isomerase n=1 Tax=Aestuariispira insulae TaxID=1461337 RepID=A0A3D9H9L6_9PROT|nr:aspartate/glutamate racemase family protein [Aestuariispira insulae]RED46177.1 maleate isomerase [Aestuariispira insulae]
MTSVPYQRLELSLELDHRAPRGRIGLVALGTDFTAEDELRQMLPDGTALFTNRVENANPLTLDNLRRMEADLTRAAAGILPGRGIDVAIFACTSGSAAIGDEIVEQRVQAAWPGIPVTNPLRAAAAAMKSLGRKRLSVLTPYIEEVSNKLAKEFSRRDLILTSLFGLDMLDDIDIAMLPFDTIREAARRSVTGDEEALFISCTATRAAQIVAELEQELGLPVLTSNQVMTWHALRLIGIEDAIEGFGEIFRTDLTG